MRSKGFDRLLLLLGLIVLSPLAQSENESLKFWHTSSIEDALLEEELPGSVCEQLTDLKGDLDRYQSYLKTYNQAYEKFSLKDTELKTCQKENDCLVLADEKKILNCTFNHCEQQLNKREHSYDEQKIAKDDLDNYKVGIMELSSDIKNNCQVLSNQTCSVCQGMSRRPANYEI